MSKNRDRSGHRRFRRLAFRAACAWLAGAGLARGATTWTNSTGDGMWNTPGNWDTNSPPTMTTAAVFPTPGPADSHVVTLPFTPQPLRSGTITFNDNYTLTGGGVAVYEPGGITVATGKTATIACSVGTDALGMGSAALVKQGSGLLALTGDNSVLQPGNIVISAGTLRVPTDRSLGGGNAITLGGILEANGTFATSKIITPTSGGGTTPSISVSAGNTLTVSSALSAVQIDLAKIGPGQLTLTQSSSRNWPFFLMQGTLRLTNAAALGTSGSGRLSIGNATLELATAGPAAMTYSLPTSLGSVSTIRGIGDISATSVSVLNGQDIAATFATGANPADALSINLTGSATATSTITISGAGIVSPTATTYAGKWNVSSGTLRVMANNSLGTTGLAIPVGNGGAILVDNGVTFSKMLNLATGSAVRGGSSTIASFTTLDPAASITLGTTAANSLLTYSGSITGGASGTVHMTGPGTVIITSGNKVAADWSLESGTLQVSNDTNLGIPANGKINFNGGTLKSLVGWSTNRGVTVGASGGTLNIFEGVTFNGSVAGPGTLTRSGGGTAPVNAGNFRVGGLNITAGRVRILPNGTAAGASSIDTLTLAAGTRLDLTDNHLVTKSDSGTAIGGTYSGIAGLVQSGRNGGGWNGNGIITSMSDASSPTHLTSIGVATAANALGMPFGGTRTWAGLTVTSTDTLVMYTYAGDATLDGKINVDDYGRIDFNANNPSAQGWYNGDFNYDGKVNVDDYGIIDFNIGVQGAPFFTGAGATSGLSAVPEPASVTMLLAACGVANMSRRRRRRRRRFRLVNHPLDR